MTTRTIHLLLVGMLLLAAGETRAEGPVVSLPCGAALDFAERFLKSELLISDDRISDAACASDALAQAGRLSEAELILLRGLVHSRVLPEQTAGLTMRLGLLYAQNGQITGTEWAWRRLISECIAPCDSDPFVALAVPLLSSAYIRLREGRVRDALRIAALVRATSIENGFYSSYFDPPWLPAAYRDMGDLAAAMEIHEDRIRRAESDEVREARRAEYDLFMRSAGE
jgi:hypothetical protein